MIISTCPMTDSLPHEIFSSACDCECVVEFMANGNMVIIHQAFNEDSVEAWGVFEEDQQLING